MAFLRGLPGIDLMPPTKIQQISLPELTINYNFKEVPRYDRCTTCHQGIDRLGYDKDADGRRDEAGLRRASALHRRRDHRSTPRGTWSRPGSTSTPTARTRSTASAAPSATAARARAPTSPIASHEPERPQARRRSGTRKYDWHEIHSLGRADAAQAVPRVELPEVPPPGDRRAPGREAPGRLPADRQVRLHRLPHDRRRGVVRPRPDRRAQVGPNLSHLASKVSRDWIAQVDQEPARVPARHADAPVLRRDQQQRPRGPAQERRRDPRDHPLPVRQEHAARRLRRPAGQDRPGARGRNCSSRRAAWPATRTGPTRPDDIQVAGPQATSNPDYKPDAAPTYDPSGFPGRSATTPRPTSARTSRTSRPSSSRTTQGLQVARQLDQRPRRSTIPRA